MGGCKVAAPEVGASQAARALEVGRVEQRTEFLMQQSKRLIFNASVIYLRMLLTVGLGLYVVRLLYEAMGIEGYGIFTALVASGAILALLNSAVIAAARRYFAFEIGVGDPQRQRQVFGILLTIFLVLAGLTLLLGAGLEQPLVLSLTIPSERLGAARWAYRASICILAVSLVATPYTALIEAYQRMVVVAAFELLNRVLLVAAVFCLGAIPLDPVLAYTLLILSVSAGCNLSISVYTLSRFHDARTWPLYPSWDLVRPIFSFTGWTILSAATQLTQIKGSMVLTNVFFGTSANAGFSLAHQGISYIMQLCTVLSRAVAPAATASEGRGDSVQMLKMTTLVSRYSAYTVLLFGLPCFFNIESLLRLWLGNEPPPLAVAFFQLLVLFNAFQMLSWGDALLADARATIGGLNTAFLAAYAGTFSIVWVIWIFGNQNPLLMMQAMVVVSAIMCVGFRPWWVGRMIERAWIQYLTNVPGRVALVAAPAIGVALLLNHRIEPGLARYVCMQAVVGIALMIAVPVFGMERWERDAWCNAIKRNSA